MAATSRFRRSIDRNAARDLPGRWIDYAAEHDCHWDFDGRIIGGNR